MACWLSYLNDRLDSSGSPPCLMGKMLKLRFLSFFFLDILGEITKHIED